MNVILESSGHGMKKRWWVKVRLGFSNGCLELGYDWSLCKDAVGKGSCKVECDWASHIA